MFQSYDALEPPSAQKENTSDVFSAPARPPSVDVAEECTMSKLTSLDPADVLHGAREPWVLSRSPAKPGSLLSFRFGLLARGNSSGGVETRPGRWKLAKVAKVV